jgi:diacylglycerol kinase family enzyme
VGEHLFLNNASFGLYPKIIRKREKATKRFGRKRIIGALSALHSLFEKQKMLTIKIKTREMEELHRTSMVFVGNNRFQLENLGLKVATCTEQSQLAAVILKPVSRLETARIIWRGIVKTLHLESKICQFCAESFTVETTQPRMALVIDGEIVNCTSPVHFRLEADALRVLVPSTREGA